jgi:hypothetical protein
VAGAPRERYSSRAIDLGLLNPVGCRQPLHKESRLGVAEAGARPRTGGASTAGFVIDVERVDDEGVTRRSTSAAFHSISLLLQSVKLARDEAKQPREGRLVAPPRVGSRLHPLHPDLHRTSPKLPVAAPNCPT